MNLSELQSRLHRVLRVTAGLCFIGHGAWGIVTKADWLPFFAVMGIPEDWAWPMMPLVGCLDITLGLLLLHRPRRIILVWMFGWCLWTALLRPLSVATWWEVWERGGNYGPPLAFLILGGAFGFTLREWVRPMEEPRLTVDRLRIIDWVLRISLALLLLGHGGFGVFVQKAMLQSHYASVGLPATTNALVAIGLFEFALAALVLVRPVPVLLWLVFAWKLASEALYPIAGSAVDVFETIERAGDYGIPLALLAIAAWRRSEASVRETGAEPATAVP